MARQHFQTALAERCCELRPGGHGPECCDEVLRSHRYRLGEPPSLADLGGERAVAGALAALGTLKYDQHCEGQWRSALRAEQAQATVGARRRGRELDAVRAGDLLTTCDRLRRLVLNNKIPPCERSLAACVLSDVYRRWVHAWVGDYEESNVKTMLGILERPREL